ncbi:DUF1003 domain-containing protein [Arcanobacterium haemolyticum]|uniref:DUF1003 domain-containing protein n=1 Tax=Arcanobacterium haemolyticum (strain ATCC 9345 / DSM 20595 / CCM 5947 / CCUG 17215 / LMG 16163 / NBRC 15585 / NCTC 8452 / 11018) TaxID=644284 RepID=D7BJW4_ARCHD|nr:DUF1003 domain-containing protein [Arcanobacterium haemolyticum]ADH92944.1 protein of unknown function DUF1003 [Arcanobacterium haemolyticum DSM 20595]QCX47022.1 DUF1003 domain-containing protein [Arcanobacterium haemolyticum]SQH28300.1 Predicted membrane protein [Arcanobacterium haemolyticum]
MANFDEPSDKRSRRIKKARWDSDAIGVVSERIARFSGTPQFLVYLSIFVALWLAWNTWGPDSLRFDSAELGFTALTLMLSLQASYAAPLILLAQNRQDDRDRVTAQQDRFTAERNLADTEYITREIASLRLALNEIATRDFVRSEIRDQLEIYRETDAELTEKLEAKDAHIAVLEAKIDELLTQIDTPEKKVD